MANSFHLSAPLLAGLLVGSVACQPPASAAAGSTSPPVAEALVRAQLHLPAAATLTGLAASATPARASVLPAALTAYLSGPEHTPGLRIVASFALPLSAVDPEFWSAWQPVPLPAGVAAFKDPPAELAGLSGYYRCEVHAWSPGTTDGWASGSCAQPPANFDSYQAAIYDPQGARLTVVVKRYY